MQAVQAKPPQSRRRNIRDYCYVVWKYLRQEKETRHDQRHCCGSAVLPESVSPSQITHGIPETVDPSPFATCWLRPATAAIIPFSSFFPVPDFLLMFSKRFLAAPQNERAPRSLPVETGFLWPARISCNNSCAPVCMVRTAERGEGVRVLRRCMFLCHSTSFRANSSHYAEPLFVGTSENRA